MIVAVLLVGITIRKGTAMKLTAKDRSRIQDYIIPQIIKQSKLTGEPVALNELPCWTSMKKRDKVRMGRVVKKMAKAGEIEGIKFVGFRADNHSTYMLTGESGFLSFLRRLFH